MVADGRSAGGAVIHVDRETGAKAILASGGAFRVPAGLGVVGGAGVDQSGGGNGDPDGPAAPPDPVEPRRPGWTRRARNAGRRRGRPARPRWRRDHRHAPRRQDRHAPARRDRRPPRASAASTSRRPPSSASPRLSATRFRAARRGRAFVAVRTGTRITYRLNEPARVTISVQKFRHLSRVCRRKVARSSRHRTGTRCRRWITVKGRFSKASRAGASSVRFRGRLNGKALKPGAYRFVIRARDGAGNVSKPRRPAFRIVR